MTGTCSIPLAATAFVLIFPGCAQRTNSPTVIRARMTDSQPLFEDVAERAGVRFIHSNGATGRLYFIESTPAGCAMLDYDNDGFLDLLLVQSGPSTPPTATKDRPRCALYRNNRDGTFTDVTAGSGLDKDLGYGQGVAVGDYDNDGFSDLFITAIGGNHLFHNEHGTGRFRDVTAQMGLGEVHSTGYATSAAFGDYNNDGRLDLYICYYCPWTWTSDKSCRDSSGRPDYCSPQIYDPETHRLYRNDGSKFTDVSESAGITKQKGRGLAVAFVDYNVDGKQDIFVANDLSPNMLWRNKGDGTFTDVARELGCAYGEGGSVMAGMGVAIADYDRSGWDSLFVTNFSGLPNSLFRNMRGKLFEDVSVPSGLALPHMKFLAFGCEFLDYDADGWADLLVANGHVLLHADTKLEGITYQERKQLFHNEGNGRFDEVIDTRKLGGLLRPMVSRGLAVGDIDNDGRLDALFVNQNGPAQLFKNNDRSANHWISFKTIGTKSNRDGLHTRFILHAGGVRQTATVHAGTSYLSHSDSRVYFGLGKTSKIDRVEVKWPSGFTETFRGPVADKFYTVTEGKGVTSSSSPSVRPP